MSATTLKLAREMFWNQASTKPLNATQADILDVNGRINQVLERFISSGKWKGSIVTAQFTVYDGQITLPRSLETVLGWRSLLNADGNCDYGWTADRNIYNRWFQFSSHQYDWDVRCSPGLLDYGDEFATYRDVTGPFYLKVTADLTESGTPTILVRGLDENENEIFQSTGIEGIPINISHAAPVTTSQQFNSVDYWVKPAVSRGIIRLVAMAVSDATETEIAIIQPSELASGYRRYGLAAANSDNSDIVEVLAKRAFFPASADADKLVPGHLGAIKLGLMALAFEEKSDERFEEYWGNAYTLLDNAQQEFQGDSEVGIYNVIGDYGAGSVFNTT